MRLGEDMLAIITEPNSRLKMLEVLEFGHQIEDGNGNIGSLRSRKSWNRRNSG